MKLYAMESGFLARLRADRRELLAYARTLGTAEAMRAARADLMASTRILLSPGPKTDPSTLYTVDAEGVAHIPIVGELTPAAETDSCGAYTAQALTEYGYIQAAISAANADEKVSSLALHIDSPGGYSAGLDETAQAIATSAKPIDALVGSMAASAAYWLASQADRVIALSPASELGSIGVALEEYDDREALASEGITHRVYTSTDAPDKRPDTATPEGRAKIIERLDALHAVFVRRVSEGRRVSTEKVNKDFGRGGLLTAEKALAAGMVDEVRGSHLSRPPAGVAGSAAATSAAIPSKEVPMDLNQLKAEHPDVFKAASDEAVAKERARVAKLDEFRGITAEADKVLDEARKSGAEYIDIAPRLTAAIAKANTPAGDNPPLVQTATPAGPAGADDAGFKALASKAGLTPEEVAKFAPKE